MSRFLLVVGVMLVVVGLSVCGVTVASPHLRCSTQSLASHAMEAWDRGLIVQSDVPKRQGPTDVRDATPAAYFGPLDPDPVSRSIPLRVWFAIGCAIVSLGAGAIAGGATGQRSLRG